MRTSRRTTLTRLLALGATAAMLSGCPGRDEIYGEPYAPIGPLEASGRLVWGLGSARTLVVLDPSDPEASPARRLPFAPRDLAVVADRIVAIGVDDEGPAVALTSITDPQAEVRRLALPAVFDRALLAPGGRHAVLIFDPNRPPEPGSPAARDANELAVVDLEAETAARVVLDTESLAPRAVEFDREGRRAVVVLDSAVVIFDLEDPSRRVTVPLVLDGGARLVPQEAVFSRDGGHVFIRTAGTPDVLSLRIEDTGAGLSGDLNFLFATGAERLQDILVPEAEGFEGYVAAVFSRPASNGSIAALLDATGDRSRSRTIELDARVNRIEDLTQGRLLLHGGAQAAPSRGPADIVGWAPLEDRVDEDRLSGNVIGIPAVAGTVAFFRHGSGVGREALTAVSIRIETTRDRVRQRPLVLLGTPGDIAASQSTVLLAVDVPREDSGAAPDYDGDEDGETGTIVLLSEADDTIDSVVLDDVIVSVGAIGDFYYAVHPDPFGDVTFVPKADPTRGAAHRRDGFLLGGLLDLVED